MVTARNYAAQAERDLRNFAASSSDESVARMAIGIADDIKESVHFIVPDVGERDSDEVSLWGDGELIGLQGKPLHLPFKKITIENEYLAKKGYDAYGDESWKAVYVATESDGVIYITALFNNEYKEGSFELDASITHLTVMASDELDQKHHEYLVNHSGVEMEVLLLLEVLSLGNVTTSNCQERSTKNHKRVKAGKLPIYETKMLVIGSNHSESSGPSNVTGSHASPRQHLRRGHVRRLPGGNVWIKPCVIGNGSNGVIDKTYIVK